MPAEWDVAVVGAGPAGSTSALLLARLGYRVVLLERAHFPRPKACAEYMSPGVTAVLERFGLDEMRTNLRPHCLPGMEIIAPRGGSMRVSYRLDGREALASTIPRERFDAALAEQAVRAGAVLREGFTVQRTIANNGLVAGVEGRTKQGVEAVRAKLTVVADGGRSALARALGLASPVRWPIRLGLVAHYRGAARLRDGYGQMHVRPGGYCGVAPLPDGLLNVAVVGRVDALKNCRLAPAEFLQYWIDSTPALRATLADCERVTPVRGITPIGSRSRSAVTGGALLVGDAASFFDPFTGEGIYRALAGAELAVGVVDSALRRGDVSAPALRDYDCLRRHAFRRKSAVTGLVQLFVQFPALMDYAVPRLACRAAPRDALGLVLGDLVDAGRFLNPRMLLAALRP